MIGWIGPNNSENCLPMVSRALAVLFIFKMTCRNCFPLPFGFQCLAGCFSAVISPSPMFVNQSLLSNSSSVFGFQISRLVSSSFAFVVSSVTVTQAI